MVAEFLSGPQISFADCLASSRIDKHHAALIVKERNTRYLPGALGFKAAKRQAVSLICGLVAARGFLAFEGALLAFGLGELAQAVHAGAGTLVLSAEAFTEGTEETAVARCEEGIAEIGHALGLLVFQFAGHAPAQQIKSRKLLGPLRLPRCRLGAVHWGIAEVRIKAGGAQALKFICHEIILPRAKDRAKRLKSTIRSLRALNNLGGLDEAAKHSGVWICARSCAGLDIPDAKRTWGNAKSAPQNLDAAYRIIAFLYEGLAQDVKVPLAQCLL